MIVEFQQKPYVIIKAKTRISKGEEISYDYGDRSKKSIKNFPWLKN